MKTVCVQNKCTACMACVEICPQKAISIFDKLKYVNASIDESKCINCGLCEKVCQVIHPLPLHEPALWTQGWDSDPDSRKNSSSGGFAYALARQIISEGGFVASCRFDKGEFIYSLANSFEDLDSFRGSRYVKSNPKGIYPEIRKLLQKDNKVLFTGLPCHVAGLKRYIGREYDNLITVDLICHGSPSPKLLEMFLKQYGYSLKVFDRICFRQKGNFRLLCEKSGTIKDSSQKVSFTQPGIKDRYSLAFLYGLIYTENCYRCPYAGTERVSDITIGDSWGSDLDMENRRKGISLALCQTAKGSDLLKSCSLVLHDVDIQKAISSNHQLREPFPVPKSRDHFFKSIKKGRRFNQAVWQSFPKACFRLDLKNLLLKVKLCKNRH